jgi:replicative DNA helicase
MENYSGRVPPYNLDAELCLLNLLIARPDKILEISSDLSLSHFYKAVHQEIYEAILALDRLKEHPDCITLEDKLQGSTVFQESGGGAYLEKVSNAIPNTLNALSYSRIIREKAKLRQVIRVSNDLLTRAYNESEDASSLIEQAESSIMAISEVKVEKSYQHAKKFADDAFNVISNAYHKGDGSSSAVPTGIKDLDALTLGFQESDLIILGARPSMGKTAFSLQLALNIAVHQKLSTVVYSLEMPGKHLVTRMFSNLARIDGMSLRSGSISEGEIRCLIKAVGEVTASPLWVNEAPGLTLLDIRNDLRRLQREFAHDESKRLRLVIIDYLQLIASTERRANDQERVAEISRGLKNLAREFKIPVVCLSQLSRKVEERQKKRPVLSDLRESGAIEQDADLVMFLHREWYYDREKTELKRVAEVIVAKHRNGPTGDLKLDFDQDTGAFHDATSQHVA